MFSCSAVSSPLALPFLSFGNTINSSWCISYIHFELAEHKYIINARGFFSLSLFLSHSFACSLYLSCSDFAILSLDIAIRAFGTSSLPSFTYMELVVVFVFFFYDSWIACFDRIKIANHRSEFEFCCCCCCCYCDLYSSCDYMIFRFWILWLFYRLLVFYIRFI